MALPSLQYDKNLTTVYTDNVTLWFSYDALIAFRIGAEKCVIENCWVGKHLNMIDGGDKANRLKRADFERRYEELSKQHGLLG